MKKENVKIKDTITFVDEITAVKEIVSAMFTDDGYTPYYRDMATTIAIAKNFLDGIVFEEHDHVYAQVMSDDELSALIQKFYKSPLSKNAIDYKTVLDRVNDFVDDCVEFENAQVMSDDELSALIQKFYKSPLSKNAIDYKTVLDRVNDFVDDCVEFEKQKIIHGKYELQSIAKLCDMIVDVIGIMPETINFGKEFIQKMENKEISEETLTNVMKTIVSDHRMPETEIYEEQRKRIAEQQSLLEEKENEIVELRKWKKEHNNK